MDYNITIRLAVPSDAPDMAEVHMRSWEVAYKGNVSKAVIGQYGVISGRYMYYLKIAVIRQFECAATFYSAYTDIIIVAYIKTPRIFYEQWILRL